MKIISSFFIKIVYVCLLFQMALVNSKNSIISTFFNYFDELVTIIILIVAVSKSLEKLYIKKNDLKLILLFSIFLLLGLISSIYYRIQPLAIVASDAFICSKFMIAYIGIRIIFRSKMDSEDMFNKLNKITKVIVFMLFLLTIHDMTLPPFFSKGDYRYFTESIQLCYPHATYLAAAVVALMCVLMCTLHKDRGNIKYLLMASFVMIMTFRVKALAFILVFWLLFLTVYQFKVKSKTVLYIMIMIGSIYPGYQQFVSYFFTKRFSPRAVMLRDAWILAKESFPFGKGFATFGSNLSVQSYSPLYHRFGYSSFYGMSEKTASYLNDGFWQIILGQFGMIGVLLMIVIIYRFFRNTVTLKNNGNIYVAAISMNIYLIISSTAETAYFNPFSLLHFIIIAFLMNQANTYNTGNTLNCTEGGL